MRFSIFQPSKKTSKARNTKPALFSKAELKAVEPKSALRAHKVAADILAATLSVTPLPTAAFAEPVYERPEDLVMPSVVEGRPSVQMRYVEGECGAAGRGWKGEGFGVLEAVARDARKVWRRVVVGSKAAEESAPDAAMPVVSRKGKESVAGLRCAAADEPAMDQERYARWPHYYARNLLRASQSSHDSAVQLMELSPRMVPLKELPDLPPLPSVDRQTLMVHSAAIDN